MYSGKKKHTLVAQVLNDPERFRKFVEKYKPYDDTKEVTSTT